MSRSGESFVCGGRTGEKPKGCLSVGRYPIMGHNVKLVLLKAISTVIKSVMQTFDVPKFMALHSFA